ncbi:MULTISPECIES: DoxX family protein [unclassified Chelatococcus]|uniref:DoxX family protein n=1 Tax=unclassified Chelatococcus TaxID=2638111 RepID=UPI001BD147EA|nr:MULTISPECIES: DoxX family protein [unclassified Chelatococcus]MBS7700374.1 DoxX family protein [Chelatococcus sp. YT9]MBX3556170.1 DoxX family protein [Chelatococcus sp.]
MPSTRSTITTTLAWLLAAFFLFGAHGNTFISDENAAAYAAWGYPDWFHYVTAVLELAAALLLLRATTRPFGAGLGALVMAAAVLTTLVNADYDHSIAPSVILLISLLVLGLSRTVRRAGT